MPLLDLIIPTYEYPEGLRRILASIPKRDEIRLIISDDSSTGEVRKVIEEFQNDLDILFLNGPKLGAIANWNFALSKVTSPYVIFLHHDEVVLRLTELVEILKQKEEAGDPRTIILPAYIQNLHGKWRKHSTALLNYCLTKLRWQLPYHNFVGATACLVIHKDTLVEFDERLKWLVDCEWYNRILNRQGYTVYERNVFVKSYHYSDSITWSKDSTVRSLYWQEVKLLSRTPVSVVLIVFFTKLKIRLIFHNNWHYK